MRRVYSDFNLSLLVLLANELELAGIPHEVRNQYSGGALGEVPMMEAMPELCVADSDYVRAETLIQQYLAAQETSDEWQCSQCGEMLGGQYNQCWQCGQVRDDCVI